MIRFTLLVALLFTSFMLLGQVEDRTETNCDGESRSIYGVGMEGKPLLVAAKGLDCSICMNLAPDVRDFADQYDEQIEVWGAMQNLYNPENPTCVGVENWENDYSWTTIFTFLDSEDFWRYQGGLPDYHVIHPVTHEAVYIGSNWTEASNATLELLSLGLAPIDNGIGHVQAIAQNGELQLLIDGGVPGTLNVEVVTVIGQQIAEYRVSITAGPQRFAFPFDQRGGVYLLRATQHGHAVVRKFAVR